MYRIVTKLPAGITWQHFASVVQGFSWYLHYVFYGTSAKITWSSVLITQLCPIFCEPMDCSPPGSSVLGILQARILEWVAIPFSRRYSRPRDRTQVPCIAGRVFYLWATRETAQILLPQQYKNEDLGTESLTNFPRSHIWTVNELEFQIM